MSKMMYIEASELKKKKVLLAKPSTTGHRTLMFTIVIIIASSLLVAVGFAYMGYSSGHYSQAYSLCKDDILSHERMGAYNSVDKIIAALKSCDGVTS
jgi:hypothetical protein